MLKPLDMQDLIFEGQPNRIELIAYKTETKPLYKIAVYRNHSFELVEHKIGLYLDYADVGADFIYSDYDDSLSFASLDMSVDLLILWLDFSRYAADASDFVTERVRFLREKYGRTILLVPFEGSVRNLGQVVLYDLSGLKKRLTDGYMDLRLEPFSGTKLSSQACLEIARDLGLNYIPALLNLSLKAIVVDLDNTLYEGVLGEDGADGIVLAAGHKNLQLKLKHLAQEGFFFASLRRTIPMMSQTYFTGAKISL